MNELREQVQEFLSRRSPTVKSWEEIFSQSGVPGPTYRIFINSLEAFAREQRRAAFEDAFIEIQRLNDQDQLAVHKFHNMFMWLKLKLLHADDPEIQRMREEWA